MPPPAWCLHLTLQNKARCLLVALAALALAAPKVSAQHKESYQPPPGTGAIEGRVGGEKAEPIVGAKVFIYPGEGPVTGARPAVYSDSEGTFFFNNLKPGRYTVGAEKRSEGYPDLEDEFYNPRPLSWPFPIINVVEGEVTKGVTIRLGPKAGRFTGRVVDEVTGEPIRDATISFRHADDPRSEYMGTSVKRLGLVDVLVPTKKRFVMAVTAPGYSMCWVGEKGCQERPYLFEFSSPITKEFFIVLRRSKDPPQ